MKETLSENQRKVLEVMAQGYSECFDGSAYYTFKDISQITKLPVDKVRIYVRALRRKGFVEYTRGLMSLVDESKVCGSGHCATLKGALIFNACKICKTSVSDMIDGRCSRCWEERKCDKCSRPYHKHNYKEKCEEFEFKKEDLSI